MNRGDIWAEIGDAYVVGKSPHLDKTYKCVCGHGVEVVGILRDMGELMEVATKCVNCGLIYVVLIPTRDLKSGK